MTRERHGHLHRHRRTAPKLAVALSAVLNLVGAFPSVEVALTVTNAVINIQTSKGAPRPELLTDGGSALLLIVLAGLVGGIVWNLLTWLLGLPSSSSHALFGVLIGAAIAGLGVRGVKWVGDGSKLDGVLGKVVLPAAMSPLICRPRRRNRHPADLQGGRRRRYPLHGPGLPSWPDRQRVAGLAGPRHERRPEDDERHYPCSPRRRRVDRHRLNPVVGQGHRCASYRPRHVCRGLADHPHARQGTGRDLAATGDGRRERFGCRDPQFQPLGFRPLHDARRDWVDSGERGRSPGADVRWALALRMVTAWLITLPAAGVVGALMWYVGHAIGGLAGSVVVVAILVGLAIWMWRRSRRQPVNAEKVNEAWEPAESERVLEVVR